MLSFNLFAILRPQCLVHFVTLSLYLCSLVITITHRSSSMLLTHLHPASTIMSLNASLRLLSMISHLNSSLKRTLYQCLGSLWNNNLKPSLVNPNNLCLWILKSTMLLLLALSQNCLCSLSMLLLLAYAVCIHVHCTHSILSIWY